MPRKLPRISGMEGRSNVRRMRAGSPEVTEAPATESFGKTRKWSFRFAAMVLVPMLLLVFVEIGLRVFGYGYPTRYFLKTRINGKPVFVENQNFARRFFPVSAIRTPPPTVMAANKEANTYRIFVFGESAAMGDPEQAYGIWRCLNVLLPDRFAGARFEVICVAMTGINSHAIVPIARECARLQGDLWVIYMGNNEMIGPFGPSNPIGMRSPSLGIIRSRLALKTTRIGQLLDGGLQRFTIRSREPQSWRGMAMFLEHEVRHDTLGRATARAHFKQNLNDILDAAHKSGAKMVLSTVASNLKDCAPFASMHSPTLSTEKRESWQEVFQDGIALESSGRFVDALERYAAAAQIENDHAELQFRLGACYLALTNHAQALQCFELARDFDALPFRTDARLNEIIRTTVSSRANQNIRLVDTTQVLAQNSKDSVPGSRFFYEHVHLRFEGNYLLAQAIADQIAKLLPSAMRSRDRGSWATAESCARQLALTDWNRYHSCETMLQRISVPPFTNQLTHPAQLQEYATELSELSSRMTPAAAIEGLQTYQQVVSTAPDDYLVRRKLAEFLSALGDSNAALEQWLRIRDLLPHHPIAYFRSAQLLLETGKPAEAEPNIREALRIRPDFAEAWIVLGRTLAQMGNHAQAIRSFSEVLRFQPENASALYYLANSLVTQNKRAEAIQNFRHAIRLRPAYWEARYMLALELARQGDDAGARNEFAETVRLRPDHATAHLNLGVALQKEGRTAEALNHFKETLRLDPSNAMARQFITQLQ